MRSTIHRRSAKQKKRTGQNESKTAVSNSELINCQQIVKQTDGRGFPFLDCGKKICICQNSDQCTEERKPQMAGQILSRKPKKQSLKQKRCKKEGEPDGYRESKIQHEKSETYKNGKRCKKIYTDQTDRTQHFFINEIKNRGAESDQSESWKELKQRR